MGGFNKVSPQRRRPHFFKIFFPQICGEKLGIPPKFWRHIDDRTHNIVSLKGPSGDIWDAELVKDANGISLQKGWQDFVKDHSISLNDFLLFRYDGCLRFTVFIFGKNACEKEDAFFASSCQDLAIIGDSSAKEKAILCLVDDTCDSPRECFQHSGSAQKSSTKKVVHSGKTSSGENNKTLVIIDVSNCPITCSDGNKLMPCESMKRKPTNSCEFAVEKQCNKAQYQLYSKNGMKQPALVIKEEPIELPEPSTPVKMTSSPVNKKTCTKRKTAEPKSPSAKPMTSVNGSRMKSRPYAVRPKERWCKQNYESGQAFVKARMGLLVSNRRPVTDEEVKKASEAARLFKSKNPTALVVMRESYVYYGFYLNLPTYFVREYLPKSSQKLKLWDTDGRVWTVNYVVYLGCGGISAHWGAFSLANNLEKDDVCIFELVGRAAMKVHIFRVVEELMPLTRTPSRFEELQPLLMLEDAKDAARNGQ